ncbi:hypothetical protein [Sunxiuqinia indica]|uniref:hypothetical protein n=1 Tax=Sunxiuqinia indica TaxID=2692584 RepID=UPI0013576314|nr:hypothetical protein [Sunxiuqinia indica]
MISFLNHIIFDRKESWPKEILKLLDSNNKSIQGYFNEEHRINKLARKDMHIRYNRPRNEYKEIFDSTIETIEEILQKSKIVGIHCTKLLDEEIIEIEKEGLKPLNKKFANNRTERAYQKGLISEELKNELIDKEELNEDSRMGKVWVFHCLSTLKDEWGLNKLLGYWGGESLYAYAKNRNELKKIGKPCIVFTSINISELDIYPELSKRMTAFYFDDNLFPDDTDSMLEKTVDVLRIINKEEKIFNDLTNIEEWNDEID